MWRMLRWGCLRKRRWRIVGASEPRRYSAGRLARARHFKGRTGSDQPRHALWHLRSANPQPSSLFEPHHKAGRQPRCLLDPLPASQNTRSYGGPGYAPSPGPCGAPPAPGGPGMGGPG